jgi:hypothetical protein
VADLERDLAFGARFVRGGGEGISSSSSMGCCTVGREGPATGLDIMYGGTSEPGLVWTAAMVVWCAYGLAVAVVVVDEQ